jgi:hypothetical protein
MGNTAVIADATAILSTDVQVALGNDEPARVHLDPDKSKSAAKPCGPNMSYEPMTACLSPYDF